MRSSTLLVWAMGLASSYCCQGAVFSVTSADDEGPGTLRAALLEAEAVPGADRIVFNLPGAGVRTISPLTPLPFIWDTLFIDGYSQPGSRPNSLAVGSDAVLLVRLDGSRLTDGIASGLALTGVGHAVRGLIIVNFHAGLTLDSCSYSTITGNFIGIEADGTAPGNTGYGVFLTCPPWGATAYNVIGDASPADRNVISGNYQGLFLFSQTVAHNSIQGNYIGTDASGTRPRGNLSAGIFLQATDENLVGGTDPGAGNVISANGRQDFSPGVFALGTGGLRIQGNLIGTDVTGSSPLGNGGDGIILQGATGSLVGGADVGAGNVIAYNQNGVFVLGASTNFIYGNAIGADPVNTRPQPNQAAGVWLFGGNLNRIGGVAPGQGNLIAYNVGGGVVVNPAAPHGWGNAIRGNRLLGNGGLGIDLLGPLGETGVTPNDPGDADVGPNGLQNFPVLSVAVLPDGFLRVSGQLDSAASAPYTLDFYCSRSAHASGYGEGEQWFAALQIVTDANGRATFETILPMTLPDGRFLTATATDGSGSTSEFCPAQAFTSGTVRARLTVTTASGGVLVSWPAPLQAWTLETTRRLDPGSAWLPVGLPVQSSNSLNYVLFPRPDFSPTSFFRLRGL